MSNMPVIVKQNPLKTSLAVISFIGTISAGVLFIDERYAKAADVGEIRQEISTSINKLRIKQLEDELFIIDFKIQEGTATSVDKAMKERKQRELEELRNGN